MGSVGVEVLATPTKSTYDKKQYRLVRLPNKLTALLISRADTATTATQLQRTPSGTRHFEQGGVHSEEEEDAQGEEPEKETDETEPEEINETCLKIGNSVQRKNSIPTSVPDEGSDVDWETETDPDENSVGSEEYSGSEEDGEGTEEDETEDEGYGESGGDESGEEGGQRKSVPKEKKTLQAAAAMCIQVGSLSDPDTVPGLAHFLEHMVFMGSKKYPDENSFDEYVSKRGGSDNASTDWELTIFQFEVQEKHFRSALERFSWFFKAPLMNESCIEREIEAVDSEFELARPKDWARKDGILTMCAKEGHPMGKFLWGNRASLVDLPAQAGVDVRAELFDFYQTHYSANRCKLAVYSSASLDELEAMVVECFGDMRNNDSPVPHFGIPGSKEHVGMDMGRFHKLCRVVPVKDTTGLELLFALPNYDHKYKSKPTEYISHLLGHEGPGSVLSLLKEREWAWALTAGTSSNDCTSAGFFFSLAVALTEEGLKHHREVTAVVFQYLRLLHSQPPPRWIYEEKSIIAQMSFDFEEPSEPIDFVEDVAASMTQYADEDILTGSYLNEEFDPETISEILAMMTPERVRVILHCRSFEKECQLSEHWFGTKYAEEPISQSDIDYWNTCTIEGLALPQRNEFLPQSFDLKTSPNVVEDDPQVVYESEHGRMWHKLDTHFKLPRAYAYIHFISPLISQSPATASMLVFFLVVLNYTVNDFTYAAEMAELTHGTHHYNTSFSLKVAGFNDKLHVLFERLIEAMLNFECPERYFNMAKKELIQGYKNKDLKPSAVALDARLCLLQQHKWSQADKLSALEPVTREQLIEFSKALFHSVYLQGLVQGNMSSEGAHTLMATLVARLHTKPLPSYLFPHDRVVQLRPGTAVFVMANHNKDDDNNLVDNYYQIGEPTFRGRVLNELLEYLMAEPCFNTLRTTMQLGYDVSCAYRNTNGCLGFLIRVHSQSSKFTVEHIDECIETFLGEFDQKLATMKQGEFDQHVRSMVNAKVMPDTNLADEASRNWTEIFDMTCRFDRLTAEADILPTITLQEVRQWFKQYLMPSAHRRKLSIRVRGKAELTPSGSTNTTTPSAAKTAKSSSGDGPRKKGSGVKRKTGTGQVVAFGKAKGGTKASGQSARLKSCIYEATSDVITDIPTYKASLDYFKLLSS
eukprot:comp20655_c0_seq1/m.26799 comp20655_c0_seq1/g.26799  ORF comp20655_c0_seq1/g.26799 comp20655_c0_seq1/m.26799 type:complete len:1155 (-) comp20655_c0_seq1:25-3489(-)